MYASHNWLSPARATGRKACAIGVQQGRSHQELKGGNAKTARLFGNPFASVPHRPPRHAVAVAARLQALNRCTHLRAKSRALRRRLVALCVDAIGLCGAHAELAKLRAMRLAERSAECHALRPIGAVCKIGGIGAHLPREMIATGECPFKARMRRRALARARAPCAAYLECHALQGAHGRLLERLPHHRTSAERGVGAHVSQQRQLGVCTVRGATVGAVGAVGAVAVEADGPSARVALGVEGSRSRLIVWPGCSASSSEYMSDVLNRGKMSKRTCMEAAGAGGHARSTCRSRRNREARVAVPVGPKRRKRDVCHHKRLVGRAPQGQRSHRISVVATASPPCAAWCRTPHSDGPTAAQWQPRSSPTLSGRSQPAAQDTGHCMSHRRVCAVASPTQNERRHRTKPTQHTRPRAPPRRRF
eukprot:4378519-Prymnesium_polylepis.1